MLVRILSNWNVPTLLWGGVEPGITSLGKCLPVFMLNIPTPCNTEIPFLSIHPRGMSAHVHRNAHAKMFRGAFFITVPHWKQRNYPPINRMDKSCAVDPCNGDHTTTKENTPPYSSIDQSCCYNSEQKKPDTEECLLYDFISVKFNNREH